MPISGALGCATSLIFTAVWAQAPDVRDLAAKSENPIEPQAKVPVQENLEFEQGPYDRTESLLKLEPVLPVPLGQDWSIVTRTIIPFEYKPNTMAASGGSTGLGDVNPTFFLSLRRSVGVQWGLGPDVQLPTGTASGIGSGKLSLGPSGAFVLKPEHWVIGAIVSNVWSLAGASNRSAVDELSVEYFVHYNLPGGWTLSTAPTMTANWTAKAGDVWTIPVGGGVGRAFKVGRGAIHPTVQAYDYVAAPANTGAWELRVEVTLLAPE